MTASVKLWLTYPVALITLNPEEQQKFAREQGILTSDPAVIVRHPKVVERVGRTVERGQSVATIESGKWVGPVPSPVDGEVVEVNAALTDNLSDINSDPYGKGWMVKVRMKGKAPASLLDAAAYDKLVAESA